MTANTRLGYPYPQGTDRVMDGDNAIQALAESVDTKLGAAASGTVAITISTAGTPVSQAVTFPAGRFTAVPDVVASAQTSAPQNVSGVATNVSQTGCTVVLYRSTTGVTSVSWFAHQS